MRVALAEEALTGVKATVVSIPAWSAKRTVPVGATPEPATVAVKTTEVFAGICLLVEVSVVVEGSAPTADCEPRLRSSVTELPGAVM